MCGSCINSLSGYDGFGADGGGCDVAVRSAIGAVVGAVVVGGAAAALSKQGRATKGGIGVMIGAVLGGAAGYATCALSAPVLIEAGPSQPAGPGLNVGSNLARISDLLTAAAATEGGPGGKANISGALTQGLLSALTSGGSEPVPNSAGPAKVFVKTSQSPSEPTSIMSRLLGTLKTSFPVSNQPKTTVWGGPAPAPSSSRGAPQLTAPTTGGTTIKTPPSSSSTTTIVAPGQPPPNTGVYAPDPRNGTPIGPSVNPPNPFNKTATKSF